MRPRHTQHAIPSFPIYSCAFLTPLQVVLGGGGGASKSGIKNKLRIYDISEEKDLQIQLVDEYELEKGEDAPMSMDSHIESETLVCGINSVAEKLQKGENENCRTFGVTGRKIKPLKTRNTLPTADADDFQKVTVLSPDGSLLAVAGTHDLSILSYPALEPVAIPIHTEDIIYDISMSNDSNLLQLVITTTHNLLVYALPTAQLSTKASTESPKKRKKRSKANTDGLNEKVSSLNLQKSVSLPSSTGEGSAFRAARHHPQDQRILFSVINTVPPRTRKTKIVTRWAYICIWNTETWDIERIKKVGDRGLTCFDISFDGRFIGYGSSDLTIGVLDADSLSWLFTILKAHDFPPTTLKFNPTGTLLVSGSADNTVRIVSVAQHAAGSLAWKFIVIALLAILVAVLAVFAKQYIEAGGFKW